MTLEGQMREYDSSRSNIQKKIKKLEEIGINIETIEDMFNQIEQNKNDGMMSLDSLDAEKYEENAEKIKKLDNQVGEAYGVYLQMADLSSSVRQGVYNNSQLDTTRPYESVMELLTLIKKTPHTDTETTEKLTSIVYPTIYNYLKLESICRPDSPLLEMIKNDSTHTNYILDEMFKDIQRLPEVEKIKIIEKEYELEQNGFDSSLLLNKELIQMITKSSRDLFIEDQRKMIKNLYDEMFKKQDNIKSKTASTKEAQEEYKKTSHILNYNYRKAAFRIGYLALSFLGVGAGGLKLGSLLNDSIDSQYTLVISVYDTSTKETTKTKFEGRKSRNNKVIVYEYYPWRFNEKENVYERIRVMYELESKKGDTIADYLEKCDKKKSVTERQVSQGMPNDFNQYHDTKFLVVTSENERNSDLDAAAMFIIVFLDLMILLSAIMLLGICAVIPQMVTDKSIETYLENIEKTKPEAKAKKEKLKEQTKELKELIKEYKELLEELKNDPRLCLLFENNQEQDEQIKTLSKI